MSMLRFQIIKRLITSVKIINVIHTMSVEWEGRKLKQKKTTRCSPFTVCCVMVFMGALLQLRCVVHRCMGRSKGPGRCG